MMEITAPLPKRIGLLADSHDHFESLDTAIQLLNKRGADVLIHLGDICDSLRPDLLEDSIRLLQEHNIMAVKGNNDFILENRLENQPYEDQVRTERSVSFLKHLPMTITWGDICFAHSLPFDYLGAFYEPIDMGSPQKARELFKITSHRILFCGHSHQSVLFCWNEGDATREMIPLDCSIPFDPDERYIIVTGSVFEEECALFDTEKWSLERISIPSAESSPIQKLPCL